MQCEHKHSREKWLGTNVIRSGMLYNESFVQSSLPIYPNVLNINESFEDKIDLQTRKK
jgi:hypothetical protein